MAVAVPDVDMELLRASGQAFPGVAGQFLRRNRHGRVVSLRAVAVDATWSIIESSSSAFRWV
jgi:hypothetical protein